jgi:hypothetical protein
MTDKQKADYLKNRGTKCPVCRSTMVEGEEVTIDNGHAYQCCSCLGCEAQWQDTYKLHDVMLFAQPEEEE